MKTRTQKPHSQLALTLVTTLILSFVLSGCASSPWKEEHDNSPLPMPDTSTAQTPEVERIDLVGLQRSLKMDRRNEELGYSEKSFNTCRAGFGYSSTHQCRSQNFVVIHFQLQCRDSEGTVSSTNYETQPVISDKVKWTLGDTEGYTQTDGSGYGQVRSVAPASQKNKKLRLTVDGKFLILTASETRRVVAPKNWCTGAFTEERPQSNDDPWGHVSGY